MESQTSFAQSEFAAKKKQTRRERFLAEMEVAVPWARLVTLIEPFYPKGERGRPPLGVERMLRVYFLQQWYALADEALEDALYHSQATLYRKSSGAVMVMVAARQIVNGRHFLIVGSGYSLTSGSIRGSASHGNGRRLRVVWIEPGEGCPTYSISH